jgi:hypothetical protein
MKPHSMPYAYLTSLQPVKFKGLFMELIYADCRKVRIENHNEKIVFN